jgi:hypothetical protein
MWCVENWCFASAWCLEKFVETNIQDWLCSAPADLSLSLGVCLDFLSHRAHCNGGSEFPSWWALSMSECKSLFWKLDSSRVDPTLLLESLFLCRLHLLLLCDGVLCCAGVQWGEELVQAVIAVPEKHHSPPRRRRWREKKNEWSLRRRTRRSLSCCYWITEHRFALAAVPEFRAWSSA